LKLHYSSAFEHTYHTYSVFWRIRKYSNVFHLSIRGLRWHQ